MRGGVHGKHGRLRRVRVRGELRVCEQVRPVVSTGARGDLPAEQKTPPVPQERDKGRSSRVCGPVKLKLDSHAHVKGNLVRQARAYQHLRRVDLLVAPPGWPLRIKEEVE